jgi:acyl-coenzyme A synthetase/AMP-(fatty) acid ligase
MELPEISECAVFATADHVRGEAVTAVVSVRGGHSVSNDSIVAHCKAKLGDVKSPRLVVQWPQLPRTPVGKIDKRRIRDTFHVAP